MLFIYPTIGLLMLIAALISQHVFGYEPCAMCVEVRLFIGVSVILGYLAACLSLMPRSVLTAWLASMVGYLSLTFAGLGVYFAGKLTLLEHGIISSFTCSALPFYWETLPLHDWLPAVFATGGLCGQPQLVFSWLSFADMSLAGLVAYFLLGSVWVGYSQR